MWSQNYLSAPWTIEDLFAQLHTNLTDPLAGWTLYEDERLAATYPYVIYRNNLGTGRDVLLWIDVTTSTETAGYITIRTFLFETQDYVQGTGTFPNKVLHGTGQDTPANVNLLINHASTPNRKNMFMWFEQGTRIPAPTTLLSIEPYTLADGTTLVNTGDDGTGYPLWGNFHTFWTSSARQGGSYFSRTHASFSRYLNEDTSTSYRTYMSTSSSNPVFRNNNLNTGEIVQSLHVDTVRSPLSRLYTMTSRGGVWSGYGGYNQQTRNILNMPAKRIDEWSGAGVLYEGYRPEIVVGQHNGGSLHIDQRGYLGEEGDFILARQFGGVVSDSFTHDNKDYRIVYVTYGTGVTDLCLSLAMRVA